MKTEKKPSFKTPADRLRAGGLDVIRSPEGLRAAIGSLSFAPAGHLLQHPREHLATDPAMVDDIVENGVRETLVVFEEVTEEVLPGGGYATKLWVINGSRRKNHAHKAEKILHTRGVLAADEPLRVKIRLFEGTMVEALMEQLRDNADPMKVADSIGVLAVMICKLLKLGVTEAAIVAKAPKGVGPIEVAALAQWAKVVPEVQARFDSGEAPVGLLPAVVAEPPSKQMAMLDKLLGAGAKTSKGATRVLRKEKAKKNGGTGERLHPRRVEKVVAAIEERTVAEGSPAFWFLAGIQFVEGKLDLATLPPVLRAQVLSALPASVTVDAK